MKSYTFEKAQRGAMSKPNLHQQGDPHLQPTPSLGDPLTHQHYPRSSAAHYNQLQSFTSQHFDNSLCPSVQLYDPPARPVTADTVNLPRKTEHRSGTVKKDTAQAAAPLKAVFPILCLISGLLLGLVGLSLTIIGYVSDDFESHLSDFFKTGGPIFLGVGLLLLIAGYMYFNLVLRRHLRKYGKKRSPVPPPDPRCEPSASNMVFQKQNDVPGQNEDVSNLFQARPKGWLHTSYDVGDGEGGSHHTN